LGNCTPGFLGLKRYPYSPAWINDDGTPLNFSAWYNGEPDNHGGNDRCAIMGARNRVRQDGWNDLGSSFARVALSL
jgi:hypothetical protein